MKQLNNHAKNFHGVKETKTFRFRWLIYLSAGFETIWIHAWLKRIKISSTPMKLIIHKFGWKHCSILLRSIRFEFHSTNFFSSFSTRNHHGTDKIVWCSSNVFRWDGPSCTTGAQPNLRIQSPKWVFLSYRTGNAHFSDGIFCLRSEFDLRMLWLFLCNNFNNRHVKSFFGTFSSNESINWSDWKFWKIHWKTWALN